MPVSPKQIADAFDRLRFLVRHRKATLEEHKVSEEDLALVEQVLYDAVTPPPSPPPGSGPKGPGANKPSQVAASEK